LIGQNKKKCKAEITLNQPKFSIHPVFQNSFTSSFSVKLLIKV